MGIAGKILAEISRVNWFATRRRKADYIAQNAREKETTSLCTASRAMHEWQ
jgi:hypothetical protein